MKKKQQTPISFEEAAKLLGAERVDSINNVSMNPISLQVLANQYASKIKNERGRPSNPDWDISRKIPISSDNWNRLGEISHVVSDTYHKPIARGQVAAMLLEDSIDHFDIHLNLTRFATLNTSTFSYFFTPDTRLEAAKLCSIINHESIW